ncbi:proline dehydrogenase family protein [Polaribacter litorisediminis]|uniref:proline dehydrogenase family protein n=1 Tax=Polaribacter litorisediminis TaxID=1908341 RepID=UPI001CBBF691|nr:proline dehydrogenase family protein [Polaribacter litorisediminis]UAM97484.1 proline dehydrogenase family protein [Polaribacter litorisediminis]
MKKIFDNTEIALALKSDSELNRALFLFEMIKKAPLVKIGAAVTNFALKAKLPVKQLIRATVFDHFCGGINQEDCRVVIKKMHTKNVHTVLDYSVEGKEEEAQFDYALQKILETLEFAKEDASIPFIVFKPTGFGRFKIYQKLTEGTTLNAAENKEWNAIKERFHKICSKAFEYSIPILIDAEESWMQNSADALIEEMMEKYNKKDVIIFNTLQAYRWDRLDYLKGLHERAKGKGFKIGMKLVRGAYMEKERDRALKHNYKDPICVDKNTTDNLYNEVLNYMVNNLNDMVIFAGTHNEESSYLLMKMMKKNNLSENDKRIWFGQLYGMSDNISYNLSALGYNVAKYLPFGPVKDVMPYLIRRAEENTSVAGQTSRELCIIKKERARRKIENQKKH